MNITPAADRFHIGARSWLADTAGRRYLDFVQGWAVNTLGHAPEPILRALAHQANRLINCRPAHYNDRMLRLSDRLTQHSGLRNTA
jgi:acetylornithine/N-succinyldiaminopimelate aminotransferase